MPQRNSDELESDLQSIEYFIRTRIWSKRHDSFANLESLLRSEYYLLIIYSKEADERSSGEALRWGKMVLYLFTIVAWMDAVCLRWDPHQLVGNHQIFTADYTLLEQ